MFWRPLATMYLKANYVFTLITFCFSLLFSISVNTILGPGLQSFFKVKVTLILREVILRHEN